MNDDLTRIDSRKVKGIVPGTLLLGTYLVEKVLDPGGMANTYLTYHKELNNTKHVIKVIKAAFTTDIANAFELTHSEAGNKSIALLKHEAESLLSIHHDAVVGYQGFQRDEHYGHCLVMEYVAGPSLKAYLKQNTLSIVQFWQLRDRLAAGLAAVHAKGIFHRDISPDNVILCNGKITEAKLIDFGIAKLQKRNSDETVFGSVFVGKYAYAAPEQLDGETVGTYSDVYSLGLVLAEALLGKRLDMGNSEDSAKNARRAVPDLGQIPVVLRSQFKAMLQPKPADRIQNMNALLQTWPNPADNKRPYSRRLVWSIYGLAISTLVAGVGLWLVLPKINNLNTESKSIPGYVTINSSPEGALVFANDNFAFIGVTPTIRAYIKSGNNTLIIKKAGYVDGKVILAINAGEERKEIVVLNKN